MPPHWILYSNDSRLLVLSENEEEVREECEEYPDSIIQECDCDEPFTHLIPEDEEC